MQCSGVQTCVTHDIRIIYWHLHSITCKENQWEGSLYECRYFLSVSTEPVAKNQCNSKGFGENQSRTHDSCDSSATARDLPTEPQSQFLRACYELVLIRALHSNGIGNAGCVCDSYAVSCRTSRVLTRNSDRNFTLYHEWISIVYLMTCRRNYVVDVCWHFGVISVKRMGPCWLWTQSIFYTR